MSAALAARIIVRVARALPGKVHMRRSTAAPYHAPADDAVECAFTKQMTAKVLIVVDVQCDFLGPHTDHLPALIENLTAAYHRVIATRFVNDPQSLWVSEVGCEKCMRGTPGAELAFKSHALLTVVDKEGYGLLGAALPGMQHALGEAGVEKGDEIHVAGVDTDACVLKTALDLFDLGYRPRIVVEACASGNGPEFHERAEDIIRRQLGPNALMDVESAREKASGALDSRA